ncbi:MAG: OadG family transporter subunit [Dehalococcoidales bacterium]
MAVDWGQAIQIGGVGFGTVFLVLVILALVLWLMGLVFSKIGDGTEEPTDTKKGA